MSMFGISGDGFVVHIDRSHNNLVLYWQVVKDPLQLYYNRK